MSDSWWPEGTNDPAFQVQRQPYGQILGGDYVRARSGGITTLPQTALRYATQIKGWDAIASKALLVVRPHDYATMEVAWGWPTSVKNWLEVSLVRSGFGRPKTVNDGQTVFRATREAMEIDFSEDGENIRGPVVLDRPLPGGRWYYYTVFFRTTPLDWVVGMQMGSPLPKRYGHQDHLWNHIPPWYQYTDDNLREGDGFLRQMLNIYGYELDLTREYVEQWQQLYHTDFTPIRLLIPLGENFGLQYQSGLGDIRYRGLIANITPTYLKRGTVAGLEAVIEAASQYECEITFGDNIMLLPDDSEFVSGTGNWVAMHSALPPDDLPAIPTNNFDQTTFRTSTTVGPPAHGGRGVMEVLPAKPEAGTGEALPQFMFCCGCGYQEVPKPPGEVHTQEVIPPREVIPLYAGVAVRDPGTLYGFSIWIKQPVQDSVTVGLLWFGPKGTASDYLSYNEAVPVTPSDDEWYQYTIQAAAPLADPEADPPLPRATYMVPYVRIIDTNYDQSVYIAGALIYEPAKDSPIAIPFAPDRYMTLGDPGETLGSDLFLGQPGSN